MRLLFAALTALGVALIGNAASADEGISVCGRLTQFTAATAERAGEAVVGSHRLALAPDTLYSVIGQNRLTFVVGNAICVNGGRGADGALLQYVAIGIPSPYCGTVLAYRPPTATAKGLLTLRDTGAATFDVAAGADLSDGVGGTYRCYSLALDAQGDAYISARVIRTVDRIASHIEACGRVTAYDKATSSASGRVAIGTRTWPIEKGFVYTGDPAGDRTDRTTVGANVCLRGGLTSSGELADFITSGFRDLSCGIVSAVVPATRTAPGSITFSAGPETDYTRYVVAAGKVLAASVGADLCVRVAVGADGNAFVSAIAFPDRTGRLGPAPSPSPDVPLADLPEPTVSVVMAPAAAEAAPARGAPAATGLLLALGVAALGSLLVIGLRRR